ncbi:MAG: hypothetical protein Tsb0014_40830 [Pleurocapsa sp.]
MTQPSAYEQYMLELVNRARLDFDAEITRNSITATVDEDEDGDIDYQDTLNYGRQKYITDYGITDPSKVAILTNGTRQVLAFNPILTDAARSHTQWMFNANQTLNVNSFSHYETIKIKDDDGNEIDIAPSVDGYTGHSPWDRATAAGYGSTYVGENIAWKGTTDTPNVTAYVKDHHVGLFKSFGHRTNIMNNTFREFGIGIDEGIYKNYNSLMTTQKFGKSGSSVFLTGVAFDDLTDDDDFYTVGEGLRGILVTAVNQANNQSFTTTTMDAGGYQMALASGTYDVSFSLGGTLLGSTQTVTIGSTNVKVDLNTDAIISNSDFNNAAVVDGTNSSDDLLGDDSDQLLRGFDGSDRLYGGNGNDTVQGLNDDDILIGGLGDDWIFGGDGNDILIGVNPVKETPGYGEFDRFRGDAGNDIFVLGDGDGVYYNHQGTRVEGNIDKGVILDFNPSEDMIQLHGRASNYRLLSVDGNTKILYKTPGTQELIGIVKNVSGLDLNGSEFTYVDNNSAIRGNVTDNLLYGGDTNQKLFGWDGNDTLNGGAGDDTIRGGTENDNLVGGKGNDIVLGEQGNDNLIGVNPLEANPGYGEVDILRGDTGNDVFVLGDENRVFYNHQGTRVEGFNDKVFILDFNSSEDIIQLHGSAVDYTLVTVNSSTQIFYDNSGTQELVGVVARVSGLNLNGTEFSYV